MITVVCVLSQQHITGNIYFGFVFNTHLGPKSLSRPHLRDVLKHVFSCVCLTSKIPEHVKLKPHF